LTKLRRRLTAALIAIAWALLAAPAGGLGRERGAVTFEMAGLKGSVWQPPESGPAPLVVFSHGFHGSSQQSTFLMRALATQGYLVVAPNHDDTRGSGGGRMLQPPESGLGGPDTWTDATYRDRGEDIARLIAVLKQDQRWAKAVDWSRVALMGHSVGGYTVLGAAGAWPSWRVTGLKAVIALSPYANPFIQRQSLGGLGIPVMYQGGTRDSGITPFLARPGGAYDLTAAPAFFVEFRGANHFAWTDLVGAYQPSIIHYTVAFLNRYLKGEAGVDLAQRLADVTDLRAK
jgi:predicted dienelactone hydrolase